jgi:hypothetical protein
MTAQRIDLKPDRGHTADHGSSTISESLTCANSWERKVPRADSPSLAEQLFMLTTRERRDAVRTVRGWAIAVLMEAGAIRECEHHGWMRDRADPDARSQALRMGRDDPPPGLSADEASAAIADVLDGIGDTCPDCTAETD